MMAVAAADRKTDGTLPNPSRLALNPEEVGTIVDGKVISSVLSKGRENAESSLTKNKHHGEGRPIAYVLWMVQRSYLADGLGWAVSKTASKNFAYDEGAPE
jgi:hypothetical protein